MTTYFPGKITGKNPRAGRVYVDRRVAEGKTKREVVRCLKRYIARRVWRLLEPAPPRKPTS